uniref:Uncharacterized protein n=1 Tax=Candidatus Kentrum sp. FW TaxID=2126338 RepID=A0A450THR5_9GAMM|nr:MAG: hypothetical protein BECKFW1821B_GA0114236_11211 [Candidatus Kentron sp. FW]
MIEDPIVAEVRKFREEHAATHGHDINRIAQALREREKQSTRPLLNPGPKYLAACVFRSKSITHSGGNRSPIPE